MGGARGGAGWTWKAVEAQWFERSVQLRLSTFDPDVNEDPACASLLALRSW